MMRVTTGNRNDAVVYVDASNVVAVAYMVAEAVGTAQEGFAARMFAELTDTPDHNAVEVAEAMVAADRAGRSYFVPVME